MGGQINSSNLTRLAAVLLLWTVEYNWLKQCSMFNCLLCLFVFGADVHPSHGSICQMPKHISDCRSGFKQGMAIIFYLKYAHYHKIKMLIYQTEDLQIKWTRNSCYWGVIFQIMPIDYELSYNYLGNLNAFFLTDFTILYYVSSQYINQP